jgi:transcriptional regulator with XRE-family HTH domain
MNMFDLMTAEKISQSALADATGVSQQMISDVKGNRKSFSPEVAVKIVEFFKGYIDDTGAAKITLEEVLFLGRRGECSDRLAASNE